MEEKNLQQLIVEYLELLRRGKYFIIVPLVISVFIGTAVAFKLPKVYRSSVKMFYFQPQVPEWAQLGTVNMYLEAMVIFVEAIGLGPDNILKLIDELDLYPEFEGKLVKSDMIAYFKDQYQMELTYTSVPGKSGKTEDIVTGFTFSFDNTDRKKAYYVANALATDFIKIFRSLREQFSSQTSSFFEDERERLKLEIAAIDQKISEFKEQHVNELPELFQANYRMVDQLNQKMFALDQELLRLRGQRRNLESSLATVNPVLGMEGLSGTRIVSPQERLAALTSELGLLRSKYSDRHPDVLRARDEMEKLQALILERNSGDNASRVEEQQESAQSLTARYVIDQAGGAFNPAYIQLLTQLEEVKLDYETLKRDREEYESELLKYEKRVGATPLVEKEYRVLDRDLESAQDRYNELVSQVLTMESAAAMEKREMGGKLKIGQPPTVPLRPIKPNMPLIIAGSVFAGLAIGIGLLMGWEFLTRAVRTPQDLGAFYDISVLAELPVVASETTARFSKKLNVAYIRVAVVLLLIATVVAVDLFYMKVDVLIIKILSLIKKKLILMGL